MNLRDLFKAAKSMIPFLDADQGYLRHTALGSAEDESAWQSEFDYLKALAQGVYDELADGAFLWEMPVQVWSDKLFDEIWDAA